MSLLCSKPSMVIKGKVITIACKAFIIWHPSLLSVLASGPLHLLFSHTVIFSSQIYTFLASKFFQVSQMPLHQRGFLTTLSKSSLFSLSVHCTLSSCPTIFVYVELTPCHVFCSPSIWLFTNYCLPPHIRM